MNQCEYLNWIAPRIVLDSLKRNLLPSPRIAQACFEPTYGTSVLAVNAHNLFGVKDNDQWNGPTYNKTTGEYYNSKYTEITADFRSYSTWEESIFDQGDYLVNRWISKNHPEIKRFADLIGNRDYKDCARILKEKSYGTSIDYDQRVVDYVDKHNLTQYDLWTMKQAEQVINVEKKSEEKMIINVHAGHNPDGMTACGAIGLIKESTEARRVKDIVISMLQAQGHTVRDCTCNDGTCQSDVLYRIVEKCNDGNADLDISIHFNAGAGDNIGNGSTTGCECYVYPGSVAKDKAMSICSKISALGYKNRGVKESNSLYVLKNTKAPTILIECCFVDDTDDCKIYDSDMMAEAIVEGITGVAPVQQEKETLYRIQVGAYRIKANAELQAAKIKAAGFECFIVEE